MQKFKKLWPHALAAPVESRQRWMRSRAFRSLLVVAGALLLMAALVPRANAATVVIYFNFEDGVLGGGPDLVADVIPPGGDNPGGGFEASTAVIGGPNGIAATNAPGMILNRTALDIDIGPPQLGMNMNHTTQHQGATFSFGAFTTNLIGLSLSFAINNQGNGYANTQLSYIIGGVETIVGQQANGTTPTVITFSHTAFPLLVGAENQPAITFVLTFLNGASNGNNLQTVIDNIQLTVDTIVPEPATVAGGLLGVLGLCWFQRRRLIGALRLLRT